MGSTELERVIRDRQRALGRLVGDQLRRARLDAGLSIRAVARAAGLDPSHVLRVERSERDASLDATVAIPTVLGREASLRLYESTGPRVRDHVQARLIETVLEALHPRWIPRLEVPVYRPVRGVIDLVIQDRETAQLVAGEGHSQLHSVERQLRWAAEKADALPSARGWPWADLVESPAVSRLLLLRSTAASRELVRSIPAVFHAAYPASTRDAYEALTGDDGSWPGPAILWVDVAGARSRLMRHAPRGVGA